MDDQFCPCCQQFTGTHNGHCTQCFHTHLAEIITHRSLITELWGLEGLDQYDAAHARHRDHAQAA